MAEIQKTISYQQVGIFSLILYAYFSFQLYFAFERAVNLIFESQGKRSLLKSMLLSLLLAFSLIIFLLWVFFAACVFLIGAEIVRDLESAERQASASDGLYFQPSCSFCLFFPFRAGLGRNCPRSAEPCSADWAL